MIDERDLEYELKKLMGRYPEILSVKSELIDAFKILKETIDRGGKIIIAGNGGSAAQAEHMVGELMKEFLIRRPLEENIRKKLEEKGDDGKKLAISLQTPLQAIALGHQTGFSTAYRNDVDPVMDLAQELLAYGDKNDCFLCFSTSGNSQNVVYSVIVAQTMNIKSICLTGRNAGKILEYTDLAIKIPQEDICLVQELHLVVAHWLCKMLELSFFLLK